MEYKAGPFSEEGQQSALKLILLNKNNRTNFVEDLWHLGESSSTSEYKIVKAGKSPGAYIKYVSVQRVESEDGADDIEKIERCLWVSDFAQGANLVHIINTKT